MISRCRKPVLDVRSAVAEDALGLRGGVVHQGCSGYLSHKRFFAVTFVVEMRRGSEAIQAALVACAVDKFAVSFFYPFELFGYRKDNAVSGRGVIGFVTMRMG